MLVLFPYTHNYTFSHTQQVQLIELQEPSGWINVYSSEESKYVYNNNSALKNQYITNTSKVSVIIVTITLKTSTLLLV